MDRTQKLKNKNWERVFSLIKPLLLVYLFFLPFRHFAAVRNTAFVSLCLFFAVKIVREGHGIDFKDRTVQAFCLLSGAVLLASLLSPYPYESLNFVRKNLVYQAVVFFVIVSEYKGFDDLKPLFYALLAGFAALTLLIIINNRPGVILNWLNYTDKKYTKGFSLLGTFYIPLAVAYIYSMRGGLKTKYLLTFFVFIEFILSVLNNHRGQIVAIVLSVAVLTIAARRLRAFIIGAAVCLIAGGVLLKAKPDMFDRYKTLISPSTYFTNEYRGWNNRFAIWSGTMDMIKQRPVTGYGYGWKKIARVVRDRGYFQKWNKHSNTYKYFSEMKYGSASPHNLLLQILFEVGLLGLAAFLFFWFTVIKKCFSAFKSCGEAAGFLKYAAAGVLISYVLINVANGLWEEIAGNLMMAFAAIILVVHRGMVKAER